MVNLKEMQKIQQEYIELEKKIIECEQIISNKIKQYLKTISLKDIIYFDKNSGSAEIIYVNRERIILSNRGGKLDLKYEEYFNQIKIPDLSSGYTLAGDIKLHYTLLNEHKLKSNEILLEYFKYYHVYDSVEYHKGEIVYTGEIINMSARYSILNYSPPSLEINYSTGDNLPAIITITGEDIFNLKLMEE